MTISKTIPLSPDTTAADIAGQPKPLDKDGNIEFDTPADNPDETVNLGKDMVDVDGVEEGDKLESQNNGDTK